MDNRITNKMMIRKGWRKVFYGVFREALWIHPTMDRAFSPRWAREQYKKDNGK